MAGQKNALFCPVVQGFAQEVCVSGRRNRPSHTNRLAARPLSKTRRQVYVIPGNPPRKLSKSSRDTLILDILNRLSHCFYRDFLAAGDNSLIYTRLRNSPGIERHKDGWPEKRAILPGCSGVCARSLCIGAKESTQPHKSPRGAVSPNLKLILKRQFI